MLRRDAGERPADRDRLLHMRDAAREALQFSQGRTREELDRDRLLLRGLTYSVLVIGEAAARVSPAARTRVPELPWPKIVGMRHLLVHAYFKIDADAVWRVVQRELPVLVEQIDRALAEWPEG